MVFRIICIVIIICKYSTEANAYYENSKQTKWIEAQNSCALATPAFRSELGVNVVNITHTVTTDLWVGYFKALTGFEYKGCIRNVNVMPNIVSAGITIGRCYSECGRKQLVGIRGRNCYCEDQLNFDEGDQSKSDYCYKQRECRTRVCNACDENDCVSIYKVNINVTKDRKLNIDEGMCLKINADSNNENLPNKRYAWTSCGQQNFAFCDFGDNSHPSPGSDNWRESANWCFAYKGNPFTYAELKTNNESFTKPIWTSITCSDVVYTYKDLNEQSTTSSDTETETATTSIEMSSGPEIDELNTEQSVENQDPDVSAIIGASVGSILLIIAIAVVVVVLKKRNKLQTPCTGTSRETKSYDTSSGDTTHTMTREKAIRMTIKNNVSESNDTNDAHTYFVLEKHVKEEACIDDTTYNTTFSAETNTEIEKRNIYNKLEIDTNATYDHAHKKRNIDNSKAEDTYDTPKMEALATKVDNNQDKFGDTNEDAYNHINGKTFKTSLTDNVYGVPHYLGNSNGEACTRQKIDHLCGGDTYSHINNTVKSRKPDNEYSVPSHLNASSGESNDHEGHYDVTDIDVKVLETDNGYSKIGTIC